MIEKREELEAAIQSVEAMIEAVDRNMKIMLLIGFMFGVLAGMMLMVVLR